MEKKDKMVGGPKKRGRPGKKALEEDPGKRTLEEDAGKMALDEDPLAVIKPKPKPSKRGRPKKIKEIKKENLSQPEPESAPIDEPTPTPTPTTPPPPQKQEEEEVVAGPTELTAAAPTTPTSTPAPVVKRKRGIRKSGTAAAGGGAAPKKVGVKGHHRNKDYIGIRDCIPDEIILPEDLVGFEHVEIFDGNYYLDNNPRMERNFGGFGIGGMENIFNPAPRAAPSMSMSGISFPLRENVVFQTCPSAQTAEAMETIDSQATQNLFL